MKKILLLASLVLSLAACEEVIKLELQPGEQRIVAEANLDATNGTCRVLLSKSGDFYASNDFEKIAGAEVSLTTPTGDVLPIPDLGNGAYLLENLSVAPGDAFKLNVKLPDGQTFETAPVEAPRAVALDSLLIEKTETGGGPGGPPSGGSGENYALTVEWRDPAGEQNFYRIKIFKNGEFQSGTYFLADDRLGDGLKISRPIIRQTFEKGDELRVQLLSVSKAYYHYFTDLANAEGRGLSAPVPYNPKGNFSGDALGYFGAWQVSEKVIKI